MLFWTWKLNATCFHVESEILFFFLLQVQYEVSVIFIVDSATHLCVGFVHILYIII